MTAQQMRVFLVEKYKGRPFASRIQHMPDEQVVAVYMRYINDPKNKK